MKTILVLIDFSQKAENAAQFAVQIAAKVNAKIHLYNTFSAPQVFPSDAGVYPFFEDYSQDEKIYNEKLQELADKLKRSYIQKASPAISFRSRPGNLAGNISEMKPWLIVMGGKSESSSLSHLLFGSNSSAVMDKASCPVLLVPEQAIPKVFKRIVFATDLQPSEKESFFFLEKFGNYWGASITVLHVSEKTHLEDIWDERYDYYKNIISGNNPSISYTDVRGKNIAEAISKYATHQDVDMVAIAHQKRSVIGQLLHKSIGKDFLNYHKTPVLILHRS
ncbi:MAG: universal stress protein [Daejeonella sp.]|uniref:universal stress protein n=1 Tax=Daejeonella sp. TaxID=2805397 RepID=UPI003C74A5A9